VHDMILKAISSDEDAGSTVAQNGSYGEGEGDCSSSSSNDFLGTATHAEDKRFSITPTIMPSPTGSTLPSVRALERQAGISAIAAISEFSPQFASRTLPHVVALLARPMATGIDKIRLVRLVQYMHYSDKTVLRARKACEDTFLPLAERAYFSRLLTSKAEAEAVQPSGPSDGGAGATGTRAPQRLQRHGGGACEDGDAKCRPENAWAVEFTIETLVGILS
jgi:hypothetical protein